MGPTCSNARIRIGIGGLGSVLATFDAAADEPSAVEEASSAVPFGACPPSMSGAICGAAATSLGAATDSRGPASAMGSSSCVALPLPFLPLMYVLQDDSSCAAGMGR